MKSKHFKIHELVPLELYNLVHEEVLWRMIPKELIETIDLIKEKFPRGTCTINSYLFGGTRGFSGLRLKGRPYYSETSQHSLFKAVDMVFSDYTSKEVREFILANSDLFEYIGGLELGISWVHLDLRDRTKEGKINLFYP